MPFGGDGGGGSQDIKVEPWGASQRYLGDILRQSQGLYQQGSPGAYPGPMVAPFNPWQTAALDWQAQRAATGSPLTDIAQQAVAGQAAGVPNPTYDFLGQAMTNPFAGAGAALPFAYQNIAQAQGPNPAMGLLGQTASGEYIGANPYLDAAYNRAAGRLTDVYENRTMPNMAAMFSRAGGLGGSAHALQQGLADEALAEGLADLGTGIYGGAYGQERANQLAAQQALGGQYLAGLGAQQAATGQLGGLGQAGLSGQMAAAGGLGGQFQADLARQLQASQLAPSLAREDYFDIGQLGQAGALGQGQMQRELDAERQRWQEAMYGPGSPQAWLDQYAGRVVPISGLGSTSQQQNGGISPAAGMMAGGLGGLAAGSALGLSNPWMIGLGLGGGLLGGLF